MPVNQSELFLRREVRGNRPVEVDAPHPIFTPADEGVVPLLALAKPVLLLFVKQFGGRARREDARGWIARCGSLRPASDMQPALRQSAFQSVSFSGTAMQASARSLESSGSAGKRSRAFMRHSTGWPVTAIRAQALLASAKTAPVRTPE